MLRLCFSWTFTLVLIGLQRLQTRRFPMERLGVQAKLQFWPSDRSRSIKSSCIAQKTALLFGHGSRKRSRCGAKPRSRLKQQVRNAHCATCQGCLLHPPPLVDLARDRKISGFFLFFLCRCLSTSAEKRLRTAGIILLCPSLCGCGAGRRCFLFYPIASAHWQHTGG